MPFVPGSGSLFESGAAALINAVNTEGVMGAGIAAQFKRLFPQMFNSYQEACENGTLYVGTVHVTYEHGRYIINVPTMEFRGERSVLRNIDKGLAAAAREVKELGIRSVAIPALGCGIGRLPYDQVKRLIETNFKTLSDDGVDVWLYPPLRVADPSRKTVRV